MTARGRAAVFGAEGQIGREMTRLLGARGFDVRDLSRARCDITDAAAVDAALDGFGRGDVVVNAAADNDVAGAEEHFAAALRVNGCGPFFIAAAAARRGAAMAHFSTDYVFDGVKAAPYRESDAPHPLNAYGRTKLCGESLVRLACAHAYVARISTVFGAAAGPARRANFVDRALAAASAGETLSLMADGAMSPTFAADAAELAVQLLTGGAPFGTYHVANGGSCSWHAFACEIARLAGLQLRAVARGSDAPDTALKRPLFSALASEKLPGLGLSTPAWQDGLRRYLASKGALARS